MAPPKSTKRHQLTADERARGRAKSHESRREKRENARRLAAGQIADMTSKALVRLDALLDDEDARIAFRATQQVLDRVLGRTGEPLELPPDDDGEPLHGWHGGKWYGYPRGRHKLGLTMGDLVRTHAEITLGEEKAAKVLQGLVDVGLIRPGPMATRGDAA